ARRRLLHGRRRGDHPRRPGPARPRHPPGGRRPGRGRPGGGRRPGRGRSRSGRPDPPRLARPAGLGRLRPAHARRLDVARARRARGPVLSGPPLDLAAVEAARARLAGAVYETTCAFSETLSELTGARCHVKLENLQMTGSFKERGAANLLLQLGAAERAQGVVAASAGNHGLAVAFHAARLGVPAVIVMPEWAPLIKATSARRYGAEVLLAGADFDEACARARALGAERGLVFVHPFDDDRVIAGQGTLGLELVEQVPDLDAVLVALGGGGLAAGVGLAVKARRPAVRVIGVEAEVLPAMRRALDAGRPVTLPAAATLADGIAVRRVAERTLALVRRYVDEVVTVGEEELAQAILLLLEIEKTVVEGAGAAPLAALVNRPLGLAGARVALVLSGGNIDVTMLARII